MNFVWLKSIILAYRNGEIKRERFIHEWTTAQETMNRLSGRGKK